MKALSIKILYASIPKGILGSNYNLRCLSSFKTRQNVAQYKKVEVNQHIFFEDVLPATILPHEIKTSDDWKNVRDKLLQTREEVTLISVDSIILSFCLKIKNYPLAYSYLQFLKSHNTKLNLATLGKCFKVFYYSKFDKVITDEEQEEIFSMYKEIRKTYNVLDASTCESIMQAISLTKYWREGLVLLDEIKIISEPNASAYSMLISSAFKNDDFKLAWHLLEEMIEKNRVPFDLVYTTYIEKCKNTNKNGEFKKNLEILFEFLRFHNVDCTGEVALKLHEASKDSNLSVTRTNVTNRGICFNCQKKLQKLTLGEEEFANLKQAIFQNVIVGKNVFFKTTPDELQKFSNFIENMKKYDVVIDGLNVAYKSGPRHSTHVTSRFVCAVVQHFVGLNKKILVLGRTHMNNWPNWNQVTKRADTFLTHSLSQDDPYLLYCALNCGLNTIVVTKDLMRSHIFKLKNPHLKALFTQWLSQSQYQIRHINNDGKVFLQNPPPFLRIAQNSNGCWHIPYNENSENRWLCVRS